MRVCVLIEPENPWIGDLVGEPNWLQVEVRDNQGNIHIVNVEDCEFLDKEIK